MRTSYLVRRYRTNEPMITHACVSTDTRALEILKELDDIDFAGFVDFYIGDPDNGYTMWPFAYRANGKTVRYRMDVIAGRHVECLGQ